MNIDKIIYEHYRYPKQTTANLDRGYAFVEGYPCRYRKTKRFFTPTEKGGKTYCRLVLDDGSEIVGVSFCSLADNFNYKMGCQIAFGRAMKLFQDAYNADMKRQFDEIPF